MKPLLLLPLRAWYFDPVSGLAVTENKGSAAPTVQLGDGATAGTFPTQLGPSVNVRKGMSFDGGDWMDIGLVDVFERTQPFTFIAMWQCRALAEALYSSIDDTDPNTRGIEVSITATGRVQVLIVNVYPGNCIQAYSTGTITRGLHSLIVTYDGSSTAAGVRMHIDGVDGGTSGLINTLGATVLNGRGFLIGARRSGAGKILQLVTPGFFTPSVWPFALTAQQAKIMHNQLFKDLST